MKKIFIEVKLLTGKTKVIPINKIILIESTNEGKVNILIDSIYIILDETYEDFINRLNCVISI